MLNYIASCKKSQGGQFRKVLISHMYNTNTLLSALRQHIIISVMKWVKNHLAAHLSFSKW